MKKTVLIVHSDIGVRTALSNCFEGEGYKVLCIKDGMEAMEITEDNEFDFVLSGVKLSGIDGFSVCRHIRKKYDSCIILIEKNMDEEECVMGYESGADDCIGMPEDINIVLMKNKGRVLTRETLLRNVCGYDYMGDTRAVDTHIKKLRAKLGACGKNIKTVIGAGYKYESEN